MTAKEFHEVLMTRVAAFTRDSITWADVDDFTPGDWMRQFQEWEQDSQDEEESE